MGESYLSGRNGLSDVKNSRRGAKGDGAGAKISSRSIRLTSKLFYVFLLYTVFIWFCEAADLFCYLTGLPQTSILSRVFALAAAAAFHLYWGKRVSFSSASKNQKILFAAGCLFIMGFCLVKCIFPDFSYDTGNYHLYVQVPGFTDNIHESVLPGRFQLFGFRLPDRMFYLFRAVLGLRLGMLFTGLALTVSYAQICSLLNSFLEQMDRPQTKTGRAAVGLLACVPFLSLLFLLKNEVLMQLGTYMVEILCLPFFIELLSFLLQEEESEEKAVLFCILGGFFFCTKMTNIVYLIPVLVLYIIKIRKIVTVRLFLGCLISGAIPVSVYLIYNGLTTGNIVYPYYNTIFHSPWFPDADFKDGRWGPRGMKELLLWPFYMLLYPDYRTSELPTRYVLDMWAGYIAIGILVISGFLRGWKKYWREGILLIVYVFSLYGWAATTGHSRYLMIGSILNALIFGFWYIRTVSSMKPVRCAAGVFLLLFFAGQVCSSGWGTLHGSEWGFRSISQPEKKANISWFFRDRELADQETRQKIDAVYLTQNNWGGWAEMLAEGKPIVNLQAIQFELQDKEEFYEKVHSWMREGKQVWDMLLEGEENLHTYLDGLNGLGYYVEDMEYLDNSLVGYRTMAIARLTMADGRENQIITAGREENSATVQRPADRCTVKALAGNPVYTGEGQEFTLIIEARDSAGNEQTVRIPMEGKQYRKIEAPMDLSGMEEQVELSVRTEPETVIEAVVNLQLIPAE